MAKKKKKQKTIVDDIAPVAKTAGKTLLAGLNYLGQGVMKGAEGIMDAGLQLGTSKANPYYLFNPDKLKEHQSISSEIVKKDSTKELVEKTLGGGKDFNKKVLDEDSLIKEDNLGGQVVQSIGQMLPGIALGTGTAGKLKEGISLGTMGVQSYGSGIEQAYQQGKDRSTANKYGAMNAAIETATEKMFAGFGNVFGKGALDDAVKKKLTGKLSEGISKRLVELGIDSIGEGVEEVASDLLQPIALKLSGMSDEELGKLYKNQNYLNDFLAGSLSGLAMGGTARVIENNTLSNNEHKLIDEITNRKVNEQNTNKFIEKEIQNRINNSDFELNTSQKEQLRKNIENELANGSIQAGNILSNKDISGIRKSVKNDLKNGKISASEITDILGNTDFSNDRYISSIFNEENQKTKSFDIDTTDIQNEKVRNLYESAKNKINNTKTSHNFVDAIAKLVEKTDRNYQFTNNQELKELGLDVDNKTVNGLMQTLKNGEQRILINMDSRQALNTVLGHETTHLLEGTTEYQDLQDSIIEYAKSKGDYEGRLADLTKRYDGIDNVDINSELTADLVGDYLFTDEKFINDLAINKPTLATKIKNVIDNLVKTFKGTNEESRLKELQDKFNKALDNIGNNTNTETKYMMTSIEGMNNGVKTNDRYLDIKNRYDKAMELSQDKNYSNEDIRQETGWFKDNTGHWEFEISDHKTKFKIKPQINTEYKMSDLFEASTLYDMYPELKDIKVSFKKMKSNGSYYALNKSIKMNNNLLDNLDNARGTLLHEIQHYIQDVEDLPQGTSLIFGNEQYANSKGEIEAADTKNRRNMTASERKLNIPESSKENPIHPNRENILNHKMNTIEKIGEKLYNKFGDKANEIVEEIIENDKEKDIQSNNRNSRNGLEELDNSSFSNTKYSVSVKEANTKQDNNGIKLSKEQQKYFADSKATDENGNLITVYHTTTNEGQQFNEFNPVGTSYYKFGEQVVNYYTDSKEMSGSYADNDYEMADTKKITSMQEIKKYINEQNKNGWGRDKTYQLIEEDGEYKLIDNSKVPNTNKTWQQVYEEANEYKKTLSEKELKQFNDMFDKSGNYNDDRVYNIDRYLKDNKYEFGSDEDRIAQKYLNIDSKNVYERGIYFDALFRNAKYHTFAKFDNKQDLFKNIKAETQPLAKRQYEGYVNITNPYTIDAEGRNWNKVESKKDSVATTKLLSLDTLTKDRLTQLAQDSKKRYDETYKEYQKWNDAKNSISGSLRDENSLDVRMANRFIDESTLPFVKEFINNDYNYDELEKQEKGLGNVHINRVNTDVMYNLYNNDFIPYSMYNQFNNTLEVPEEARNKANEIINQNATYNEYDSEGHNPEKKQAKLIDIWEKYVDSFKAYENNGRYDYSLFDSQLLDGYLKEDLKNLFPIKEPAIGINYDYLKQLYKSASHNFDENYIRLEYNDWSVTNDIVKSIIELNDVGENYDGVIIKNVVDYGGYSDTHDAHDLFITFNSNQFKAIDNTNPTADADIRYSVDDIAPTGDYKVFSKDIKQVQNSIQDLSNQINELKDELAPIKYSVDPYAEFGKSIENDEGYNNYIENLVNEQSNIAPYKQKAPQTYEDFLYDRESTKDVRELEQKQQNRIEREPQAKTTREKISDAWDTFQSHFVNRNQQIDKISKITGNNEIKYKGDRVNNIANEISGDVFMAQTDNYGNAIGKSLDAPFERARELGLSDYFDNYLKHQSNIERHARGKGSAVVDAETSKKYVKAYETKYPELKEMAKDVYKYNQNLLNNAVENGLITEDFKNQLNTMYGKYVPFYEKSNSEPNTDTSIEEIYAYTPIRSAKGGTDGNLLDIEQAMMKQTYSWKNSIAKNDLYKEIGESLQDKANVYVGSDPTTFNNTLYADENGKYMTYFLNGEEQAVRISNDLYKELSRDLENQVKNLEEKYSVITKPLQKLSDIRGKFLTSYNPSFILRNPIKDVQDALINTKNLKGYLSNYSSSFTDSKRANKLNEYASKIEQLTGESINNINPDELTGKVKKLYDKYQDGLMWNRFITSYGNNAVELQYGGDTIIDMNKKNNKFIQKIKDVNNFMELMSRYPEFKQTIENGGSFTEALYNAREVTTNFGRGGTITKAMNRNGATFLNASVQGMDKFIRNFSGQNGSRAFVGAVARAIEIGMVPTIINHLLNAGDDDYEELKDYIKDNYYLFKTGDGEFIRIPKGRMTAVLGSAARRTMEYAGGENEAYEGYLDEVNSQIGINNPEENNVFAPLIQAFGSKNGKAWYGDDLVPSRLQNKPVKEQYDESTDALSIKIGQTLGISPYKVNYVLDQYSGGIGDIVLPMLTKKTTNGAESVADYVTAPIKDAFEVDSTTDNKYPGQIYDLSEKLQTQANGSKATDFEKVQSKYINAVAHDMNELYAKKREIQNSDMPNKEKLVEVKAIQDEINALAQKGYDNYQEATMSDTYALIGNKEFRKNTENEWKSLSKSDVEKLEGATPDEKSEYFYVKNEITNIKDNYKDVTSKEDKISKKREIIESILSSDLNDNLISKIYSSYYSRKASENIYNSGGSMKNFLEYEYDTADFEKEREKINYLYNSGFNNTTKQAIYENKFENMEDEKVSDYEVAINYGVDINSWLKLKSQAFEADVAANGKKISGTKKAKIMSCIQSLKLNVLQKALLMKLSYSSYKAYDQQIYEYLEKENMPKSEKEKYAEQIGLIKKG